MTALSSSWRAKVDLAKLPASTTTSPSPAASESQTPPPLSSRPSPVSVSVTVSNEHDLVTHLPIQRHGSNALADRPSTQVSTTANPRNMQRFLGAGPASSTVATTPALVPLPLPSSSGFDITLGSIDVHLNIAPHLLQTNVAASSSSAASSANNNNSNNNKGAGSVPLIAHFDGPSNKLFLCSPPPASSSHPASSSTNTCLVPFLSLDRARDSNYAHMWNDLGDKNQDPAHLIHLLLATRHVRVTSFLLPSPTPGSFSVRLHLTLLDSPSLATAPPPIRSLVRLLYPHSLPKPASQLSPTVTAANLAHLFSVIDASQDATYLHLVPENLATATRLYPFQRRTVGWCLARELGRSWVEPQSSQEEHALRFVCLRKPHAGLGIPGLWMDVLEDMLVESLNEAGPEIPAEKMILPLYNGFLAEEMGLGKSLIMLAVAVANPFSESIATSRMQLSTTHIGPPATESTAPAPKLVKTTLIVTPPSLLSQWQTELATHTPSLTVLVYQGGSRTRQDPRIDQYDVVLTTFKLLIGEFDISQSDHGRSRRFERKYERPVSHLAQCVFWRVVMDEAQMVPGETSKVTQLLDRIPRIHSWCMTGTPFSRSIPGDLAHMSRFLRHPVLPFARLLTDHPRLFAWYVRHVMHRTAKAKITHELDLPAQHDFVVRLPLNAVEADSYDQVAREWRDEVAVAVHVVDRGEPEHEVGEHTRAFEARYRQWVDACAVLTQALSTLRLAANHPALARRLAGADAGGHGRGHGHGGGGAGGGAVHGAVGGQRFGAADADAGGAGGTGTHAFAIVNVLRDAFLRNVSEYYRLQREVGAVKVKQAVAYDRLEEFDTAIELLSARLTHLNALSDSLAADKVLAQSHTHASASTAHAHHDLARISHLDSELQLQIHQNLFLLAGLYHVTGDRAREEQLYAQAEAVRRDMLKEHIVHVEKAQAVVKKDAEQETRLHVGIVSQVKSQVQAAVLEVAVKAGGDRDRKGQNEELAGPQRHRPWAKPRPPQQQRGPGEAAGKGKRKRKRPVDEDLDEGDWHLGDGMDVDSELAGLHVMGRTLDDALDVLDALETQVALVDEWRTVLEEKLLMPLYRDQPAEGEEEDQESSAAGTLPAPSSSTAAATFTNNTGDQDSKDQEGPSEYELDLQSQHVAESYLAQLTALVHDIRHILNRTAPLSAIDAQATKKRRAPRNRNRGNGPDLTNALGEAVIDMLDMGSLHEAQLAQDQAGSEDGLAHPELERPMRAARLDAVVPVASTSLYAVQHLLARIALDEQMSLGQSERDRGKTLAARLSGVVDHMLRQVARVEAALVHYRRLFNARVVYFQELQEISDSVTVPDELQVAESADRIRADFLPRYAREVQRLQDKLPGLSARRRYLRLLVESYGEREEGVVAVDCIVCAGRFENGYMTPCGHLACRVCMRRWLESHPTCPECRMHVRPSDLATVIMHVPARPHELPRPVTEEAALDGEPSASTSDPSVPATTSQSTPALITTTLLSRSSGSSASASNRLLPGWQYTSIQGQYGAKITAATQLVCTIMAREPAAKVLCFSQFEAILDVIKHSLALNHVPAVHFSPAAVYAFQTDRDTRVLLLNAKSQAAGLTLNAARYILMVEPIANAAIDRQAITRVHRIGQQHTTHVVRLVVAGTVEERVHDLLQSKYRDLQGDYDDENENAQDEGQEQGAGAPAARTRANEGAALGVAKVASKAFNGRNEIVDPVDMLFCLAERQVDEEEALGARRVGADEDGDGMDLD